MMGVPIKKLHVTNEESKAIIRAALGNKLPGGLPQTRKIIKECTFCLSWFPCIFHRHEHK